MKSLIDVFTNDVIHYSSHIKDSMRKNCLRNRKYKNKYTIDKTNIILRNDNVLKKKHSNETVHTVDTKS